MVYLNSNYFRLFRILSSMADLTYSEFARMIYSTGILSDPWLGGRERFRLQSAILSGEQAESLKAAAENIGKLYHELAGIVLRHPELLDDFFNLTPWQKAMWIASEGRWHGIARVDLFICKDGSVRACEMNSDTPSGEAEAAILNNLLHQYHPNTIDPNAEIEERFFNMLLASHQAKDFERVAIIYPTDLPEDLSMIAIYRKWLEARGCQVILGSPYNLAVDGRRRVTVMCEPVDLIIRHYKTDWWGERELVWANQAPFADPDPLQRELTLLLEAERDGRVTVVNPFGAVVTQNKKAMALMWERRALFSKEGRNWIDEYIPETRRLSSLDLDSLSQESWVLKSDYGCEGDSVVCGPFVKPGDWRIALVTAIPQHWLAQRFFEVAPSEDG
ncbi:MAG: glutathionylspermidine synthase family protein, partial [Blastocatellia bacterium]|nr:glutathionylspermidine synthase family protein [Blastocatellia bacterium]